MSEGSQIMELAEFLGDQIGSDRNRNDSAHYRRVNLIGIKFQKHKYRIQEKLINNCMCKKG